MSIWGCHCVTKKLSVSFLSLAGPLQPLRAPKSLACESLEAPRPCDRPLSVLSVHLCVCLSASTGLLFSVSGTAALSPAFPRLPGPAEQSEVFPAPTAAPDQQEASAVPASCPAQWSAPEGPGNLRDHLQDCGDPMAGQGLVPVQVHLPPTLSSQHHGQWASAHSGSDKQGAGLTWPAKALSALPALLSQGSGACLKSQYNEGRKNKLRPLLATWNSTIKISL